MLVRAYHIYQALSLPMHLAVQVQKAEKAPKLLVLIGNLEPGHLCCRLSELHGIVRVSRLGGLPQVWPKPMLVQVSSHLVWVAEHAVPEESDEVLPGDLAVCICVPCHYLANQCLIIHRLLLRALYERLDLLHSHYLPIRLLRVGDRVAVKDLREHRLRPGIQLCHLIIEQRDVGSPVQRDCHDGESLISLEM